MGIEFVLLPKEITLFSNCTGLVSLASQFFYGNSFRLLCLCSYEFLMSFMRATGMDQKNTFNSHQTG